MAVKGSRNPRSENTLGLTTAQIMRWVTVALLPGMAAYTWVYGLGVLGNAAILIITCMVTETICVAIRQAHPRQRVHRIVQDVWVDGSSVLTALLICICLPPGVDVSVLIVAGLAAIGLAKHAYGGTGHNTFNPAMVGYAVVLISYPDALTNWPTLGLAANVETDTLSGATILTQFRYREALTTAEFAARYITNVHQTNVVAAAFLFGGILLVYRRIINWRIPVTILLTVAFCALIGHDQGSSESHGSIMFHWTSGGLIAAAFFVATDPVTHPMRISHQVVFAILVGVLLFWIRTAGSFPDGIAFAILLGNCVTPLLNRIHLNRVRSGRDDGQLTNV